MQNQISKQTKPGLLWLYTEQIIHSGLFYKINLFECLNQCKQANSGSHAACNALSDLLLELPSSLIDKKSDSPVDLFNSSPMFGVSWQSSQLESEISSVCKTICEIDFLLYIYELKINIICNLFICEFSFKNSAF